MYIFVKNIFSMLLEISLQSLAYGSNIKFLLKDTPLIVLPNKNGTDIIVFG